MLEFRLLGSVEIVLNGKPIGISAPRQEIMLSMLLLDSNQVVSVRRLIDALWDADPPSTAKSQVQFTVSALRRLLGHSDGSGVITTRSPGYLIHVSDDALDVKVFERLAARGEAAAAEKRPEEAVQHLRAALKLWRGPAMTGVSSRLVQSAATRLNEKIFVALESCLELELALGRHNEVVGELTELVAENPLRERFRAQLMLALYRSGRQAEALEVYRKGRDTFQEELGLDLDPELRALEQAILQNAPELRSPAGSEYNAESAPAVPIPRQLPATSGDIVGRDALLRQVRTILSPGRASSSESVAVVTFTGPGGVGKTSLAIHAAHLIKDEYPDGQLFARLQDGNGQQKSPASLLEQILRSFGVEPSTLPPSMDDRAALYRSLLAERRVLIVLDDVDSMFQVTPLLPGTPRCAVIITTRNRLTGLVCGGQQFEIAPLDEQSSVNLVTQLIGPARAEAELHSVRDLVRFCEYLPLAIRIVAAKLAARPHWAIHQMVRRLENEKRRLDELDLGCMSMRATISLSYQNLDKESQTLLRRLGLLGSIEFASWVCAPLLDRDLEAAENMLENLVDARLVEVRRTADGSVRFQVHDLVRIYLTERLVDDESTTERIASIRRYLGCWLTLAAEAHRRVYGGDYSVLHGTAERWHLPEDIVDTLLQSPMRWFRREHEALVAAIFRAAGAGFDELCWDLALTSVTLFQPDSHVTDWRETHEAALGLVNETRNRRGQAAILYSLGILALTSHLKDASSYFERALKIMDELGDTHGRALALGGLGYLDRLAGRYGVALARYAEALQGFQEAGDLIGEAHMLKDIALIHMDQQQNATAESLLQQALKVCRRLGAQRVTAQTLHQLGEFYLQTRLLESAREMFSAANTITESSGDVTGQAYTLLGIGIVRTRQSSFSLAEASLNAALAAADHAQDLLIRGRVLLSLAELDVARGQPQMAMGRLDQALQALGDLGPAAVWRARVLELVGRLREQAGHGEEAVRNWRSALELVGDADPLLYSRLMNAIDSADASGLAVGDDS
ncbi:BTAD domain-containing putative transcriptional regulator [Nonomuraea sp. B19D2]|uniref:AfsR/SARP family transcriptional regulator n=1 Tax=Nonomuraea sp. B19D2 TaxID=3159561 RepID=UPI0032DA3E7C